MRKTTFGQWAYVEALGHSKYVGFVTVMTVGALSFVRVDVPDSVDPHSKGEKPGYTKLLGGAAIFAITPLTEASARAHAWRSSPLTGIYMPGLEAGSLPLTFMPSDQFIGNEEAWVVVPDRKNDGAAPDSGVTLPNGDPCNFKVNEIVSDE